GPILWSFQDEGAARPVFLKQGFEFISRSDIEAKPGAGLALSLFAKEQTDFSTADTSKRRMPRLLESLCLRPLPPSVKAQNLFIVLQTGDQIANAKHWGDPGKLRLGNDRRRKNCFWHFVLLISVHLIKAGVPAVRATVFIHCVTQSPDQLPWHPTAGRTQPTPPAPGMPPGFAQIASE